MKVIQCFMLLLLVFGCLLNSNAQPKNDLQLTTEITHKFYCVGESDTEDAVQLLLKLKLIYTNKGQQPLILQRGSNNVTWIRVSRTLDELESKQYEYELSLTLVTAGKDVLENADVPSKRFVVLLPGEVYVTEGEARVIDYDRFLTAGEHMLQVIVPTWSGTKEQADRLKVKWESVGVLYFLNAFSKPMKFTVEKTPKTMRCP